MHRLGVGLLIFAAGWGLGWYTHHHWGTAPLATAERLIRVPSTPVESKQAVADATPAASADADDIAILLQRNAFEAAVERYESLQAQAGDVAVADARTEILSHARRLIAEGHVSRAEQLLQHFLVAAYHDVEARVLLAEAYHGQEDFRTAIDQLYEARGYAYRPAVLQRISRRIRTMVDELTRALTRNKQHNALLALYQHLTQLEPDHAPYFMELAATQLALDDTEAARRSLLLVAQDPEVGARAQAMLSELSVALAGSQDTEPEVAATEIVGIPLHRSGNHFIVDAQPARGRSVRLLIDTGASLTILTPDALERRGIGYQKTGRTGVFNTANGPVRAPIYTLDALAVGDWQVSQLEIGVLELGGRTVIDGLLGMNFLRHFQFFIDQNEAVLRLSTN